MPRKSATSKIENTDPLKDEKGKPKSLLPSEAMDIEAFFASQELLKLKVEALQLEEKNAQLELQVSRLRCNELLRRIADKRKAVNNKIGKDKLRYEEMTNEVRTRLALPDGIKIGFDPNTFNLV